MVYRRKGRQERGSTREVKTRIPIEEYKEWKRRAELLDITVASYIRDCVRKGNVNVIIKNSPPHRKKVVGLCANSVFFFGFLINLLPIIQGINQFRNQFFILIPQFIPLLEQMRLLF